MNFVKMNMWVRSNLRSLLIIIAISIIPVTLLAVHGYARWKEYECNAPEGRADLCDKYGIIRQMPDKITNGTRS